MQPSIQIASLASSLSSSVRRRKVGFGQGSRRVLKRGIDIGGAAAILLCLAPLLLAIAAVVAAVHGRPIFYKHRRIGRGGHTFSCLKFRTMVADGEQVLREHIRDNPDARAEWVSTRKLRDDPRVTAVGRALRKSSLDELPQLINVLRGEMSLVGPRPIVGEEEVHYGDSIADYKRVRPGLTGPWQVGGRSDASYEDRVRMDSDYAARLSLGRDMVIILKTIPAVLKSRGSY